jgi:transcription antitermination factor NusG
MKKDWYVVYTKPRSEKKVAERLERQGFEVFLPLNKTVRQWSDRKKKVEVPLFNSYLFVHLDLARDQYPVLDVEGVVRFVYYLGKPAVVREQEIERIRFILQNYTEIEAFALQPGASVRITGGSLKGNTGTVAEQKNDTVTLVLDTVGFCLTARIPVSQVILSESAKP